MRIEFSGISKTVELELRKNFAIGVVQAGHDVFFTPIDNPDLVCIIGVKSFETKERCVRLGIPYLYFDKGYNRRWPDWWRVSINAHNPTAYLNNMVYSDVRAGKQGWIAGMRAAPVIDPHSILIAGSSAKCHRFHGIEEPTSWTMKVVEQIKQYTDRKIVYRPKPSWNQAVDIPGTVRSRLDLKQELARAYVVVTYCSGVCFNALLQGVPTIVFGDGVSRLCSDTSVNERSIKDPYFGLYRHRHELISALAYCQWNLEEFANGKAWETIEAQLRTMVPGIAL